MSNRRRPKITHMKLANFTIEKTGGRVVVLDRIVPGVEPDYCIHGQVTCAFCPEWCWLGDHTHDIVQAEQAAPICQECAIRLIPPGTRPVTNTADHRRADGPHD